MKKRTLTAILMIAAVITAMFFTACGGKEAMTLEKYVKDNPDVSESIDSAAGDSNVNVEIKGNEIIYTFDLSTMEQFDEETAKSDDIKTALEQGLEGAAGTFGNISKTIEDSTEIQGISTTVKYTWGDEVLIEKTYTSADAAAE